MRTSLFNDFANLTPGFHEDFGTLWALPADQRQQLIPHVLRVLRTATVRAREDATNEAVTAIGGNSAEVLRALRILRYVS